MFSTWLFAYRDSMGDRMIREFNVQPVRLPGYRRAFCHKSTQLWGTPERPCPVLGLVPGEGCWGVAFRVPWTRRRLMVRRLAPQEAGAQFERVRARIELQSGEMTKAVAWVSRKPYWDVDRSEDLEALAAILKATHGTAGKGVEYIREIVHCLELWGLRDPVIEAIWARLEGWRPR